MTNYTETNDEICINFSTSSSYVYLKKEYILRLYNFISSYPGNSFFNCNNIVWMTGGNCIYTNQKDRQAYLKSLSTIIKELMKKGVICLK